MNHNPREFYNSRIKTLSIQLETIKKTVNRLTLLRLISFLCIVASVVLLTIIENKVIAASLILLSIVLFAYFIKLHLKKQEYKVYLEQLLNVNLDEIKFLDFDFTKFADASEFNSNAHPYAFDLNVFGYASLFQYINRTSTSFGKIELSKNLLNPDIEKENILEKQQACNELSAKVEWRQDFQAVGASINTKEEQVKSILEWVKEPSTLLHKKWLRWTIMLLPFFSFLFLVYGFISGVYVFANTLYLIQFAIILSYTSKANKVHAKLSQRFETLSCYSKLFDKIEQEDFQSSYLGKSKQEITSGQVGSSKEIKKLAKILEMFDRRLNVLAAFVLNAAYMSDLRAMLKLEQWKESNRPHLEKWLEALAKFDAINSFANFAYNNPDFCYPELSDNTIIEAEQLGHPLIHSDARVSNNFTISNFGQFVILTGANMAGKSTFLRTVGINIILAMNGAPVCAKKFKFTPLPIYTSISVKDSLVDNESYFYAELKRLRMIIDELEAGHQIFIILDEILKGTNSADKLKGSRSLLQKLTNYKAVGIVATHDIALGELEQTFPANIINHSFEVQLEDDRLFYDYKLHQGVCKNLNASFLMRKMGIIS